MMLWLRMRLRNSVICFDRVLPCLNVLNIQVNRYSTTQIIYARSLKLDSFPILNQMRVYHRTGNELREAKVLTKNHSRKLLNQYLLVLNPNN